MDATASTTEDFCVGDWLVQPKLAKIRRGDEAVHVTPRAMAVLVYLANAKGAVVSRNEILDAVWPRMAVTPDALSQCIVELRKAFRDNSKRPSVIETIPKVGIRLIAPVDAADAAIAVETEAPPPSASSEATSPELPPYGARRLVSPLTGSPDRSDSRRLACIALARSNRAPSARIGRGRSPEWPFDCCAAVLLFERG